MDQPTAKTTPRCAKLHNWKPPKPKDDFLTCMDCGRKISLSSPEDAFKLNAIIHRSERLTDAIIQARANAQARRIHRLRKENGDKMF